MSVDTNGRIYYKQLGITLEDVINAVKGIYDKNAQASIYSSNEFYRSSHVRFIDSNSKESDRNRTLTIIEYKSNPNMVKEDEPYIYISLGLFGNAKDIIFNIVKQFGGEMDEDDCDDIGYVPVEKDAIELPKVMEVTYDDICKKFGCIVKIKEY